MNINFGAFLKEVLADYAGRFWIFWLILYAFAVLTELSRQILLESLNSLKYADYSPVIFGDAIKQELLSSPVLFLPLGAVILFHILGFGALYLAMGGASIKGSVIGSLKKFSAYFGYLIAAGILTSAGFLVLTVPILILIRPYLGELASSGVFLATLTLILGAPGIYLLVALSNGPFVLMLEGQGIKNSILMSFRRVKTAWMKTAVTLGAMLILAGLSYFLLFWLLIYLKLSLLPDFSFRVESMIRVFIYSIPWVVAASFYDLGLYHIYQILKSSGQSNPTAEKGENY